MSPPAAGVIYVSDKIIKQMTPKFIKLYIDRNPTPSYFTWLHPYLAMYDALNKSLSSILEEGIDNIEKRVLSLTQWIIDDLGINPKIKILTPSSKRRRAGIVAFSGEFDASKLQKYLTKKKIIISRENRNLIISVHYRHTEEEIEKLILTIREGLRQI
jgi:selenocysteine lyase/cysteine desulfurase